MGWMEERKKSLMRRLRGEYYYTAGDNVIFDEKRGEIRHQYNFSPSGNIRAEHLRVNRFGTESVIRYHLMAHYENPDLVWVGLVEDTIHELCHWAMDDKQNSVTRNDGGDLSNRWREVIFSEIEYVDDDIEINHGD